MPQRIRGQSSESAVDPGPPGAWARRASCGGLPVLLLDFFGKTRADWGTSKSVCKACPVRRECLEYALDANMVYGVWGGLDQLELRFTLGRDATGATWTYPRVDVKCPYCRGRTDSCEKSYETAARKCVECGFEWTRAERKRPKRKRRVQPMQ